MIYEIKSKSWLMSLCIKHVNFWWFFKWSISLASAYLTWLLLETIGYNFSTNVRLQAKEEWHVFTLQLAASIPLRVSRILLSESPYFAFNKSNIALFSFSLNRFVYRLLIVLHKASAYWSVIVCTESTTFSKTCSESS